MGHPQPKLLALCTPFLQAIAVLLRLGTAFLQLHPQKEQLLFRLGTFPFLGGDGFVKFRNLRLLGLQGFLLLCGVIAIACLLRCQSPDGFQIMVNIVLQHGDFSLFGGGFAFVFGSVVSSLLRLGKTKIRLLEQRFDFSVQRFRLGHHPFMAAANLCKFRFMLLQNHTGLIQRTKPKSNLQLLFFFVKLQIQLGFLRLLLEGRNSPFQFLQNIL